MRTQQFAVTLAACAAGAVLVWLPLGGSLAQTAGTAPGATVGQPAPDFTLRDQSGTEHRLSALRGKVVVLEWTNPRCPFVQRHYREQTMKRAAARYDAARVVWLAIDSSNFVTAEATRTWRTDQSIPYPILLDADGAVGRRYGARATPHMFVIDARGVLRYLGAIDDDPHDRLDRPRNYVAAAVDALLARRPVTTATTDAYGCSVKYAERRVP